MNTATSPAAANSSNQEPGYRAVLVREETKLRLRDFRANLQDRDLNQERRLATAALEMVLDKQELQAELLSRVDGIVRRDLDTKALKSDPQ